MMTRASGKASSALAWCLILGIAVIGFGCVANLGKDVTSTTPATHAAKPVTSAAKPVSTTSTVSDQEMFVLAISLTWETFSYSEQALICSSFRDDSRHALAVIGDAFGAGFDPAAMRTFLNGEC